MKRSIAGLVLAAALPAAAQWKLPDDLPPLPQDGETCNDAGTHCLVNAKDWFAFKIALEVQARRISILQQMLAEEQARKTKRCAVVTPGTFQSSWLVRR